MDKDKVALVYRHENPHSKSIELVFNILLKTGLDLFFKYQVAGKLGLSSIINQVIDCHRKTGRYVHITGDVHYLSVLAIFGKEVTCTVHDLNHLNTLRGIKKYIYFMLWVYMPLILCRRIFAISPSVKKQLETLKRRLYLKTPITLIPNPLVIPQPKGPIVPFINRKYDLIHIGTQPHKNLDCSFNIAKKMNLSIAIVGKLSLVQRRRFVSYRKASLFHNLSDHELQKLYLESKILLFPSSAEGFGLPIIEAQASSCIVIANDIQPLKWVVGKGGITINVNDEEILKSAIAKIMADEVHRNKLVENGRENVTRFSREIFLENYREYFTSRLQG